MLLNPRNCALGFFAILLSVPFQLEACAQIAQESAEHALRNLGRFGSHVFRTNDDAIPHITLLQLTASARLAEMQQLPRLSELRSLRLMGLFTNASMVPVGRCRQLRDLYLRGTLVREDGISALTEVARIETLWLVEQALTEDIARALLRHRTLRTLVIAHPTSVDATAMEVLSHHSSLREVRMIHASLSDNRALAYRHIASIPHLRSLHLTACDVTDDIVKDIAGRARGLQSFHLDSCAITDHSREALGAMASVEDLSVMRSSALTDRFVVSVSALPKLRRLNVGGTAVTPSALMSISKCRNLESLGLAGMDSSQGTIMDFRWLGSLKALKSLDLRGVDVSRDEMNIVAGLPDLEVLSWHPRHEFRPRATGDLTAVEDRAPIDDVLEPLVNARSLKTLRLRYAELSNSGLGYLVGISSLRRLDCSATLIDDNSAEYFARLQQLESLRCSSTLIGNKSASVLLKLPRLRELDLGSTAISDVVFSDLGEHGRIRYLDLTNTLVTDRTLECLGKQSELRFLIVNQTKVTDAGIAKLVDGRPMMYVSRQFEEFGPRFTTHVGVKAPPKHGEMGVEVGAGLFIDGER